MREKHTRIDTSLELVAMRSANMVVHCRDVVIKESDPLDKGIGREKGKKGSRKGRGERRKAGGEERRGGDGMLLPPRTGD